uniref:Uncharacterized protein n=1 Tax=Nelumbo nucifera TaxID=4432 RepID=A0A822Y575_NELNU|nr:TPA_asm: hypothetical protein HUJ06_028631 [Nelumbo nucifera]
MSTLVKLVVIRHSKFKLATGGGKHWLVAWT